jgi:sugar phosphate isomerase/epimerase
VSKGHPIYLATMQLEVNRWTKDRRPSYRVSDWATRFVEAGFDGIELWEHHASLADAAEQAILRDRSRLPLPVAIFNTYATLYDDAEGASRRALAADWCAATGARGVKYNFDYDPSRRDEQVRVARAWLKQLPAGTRMLCECHPQSLAETPEGARDLMNDIGPASAGVQVVLHSFHGEAGTDQWFDLLGADRIAHSHVQVPAPEGDVASDPGMAGVRQMLRRGYRGSFSVEFTAGARAGERDVNVLWAEAQRDLARLRRVIEASA